MYLCFVIEIIRHIEQLIITNDCVVIPDFGSFIVQNKAAEIRPQEHLFLPPCKEISFNQSIQHNDGLLAHAVMQSEKVSYDVACVLIQKGVALIKTQLLHDRNCDFGQIGHFVLDEQSKREFIASVGEFIFPDYFGLPSFRCVQTKYLKRYEERERVAQLTVSEELVEKVVKSDDFINIRIRRSFIRNFFTAAAVILFFVFVSTPVQTQKANYASLLPVLAETPESVIVSTVDFLQKKVDVKEIVNEPLAINKVEEVKSIVLQKPMAEKEQLVVKKNGRSYYIVIGSVLSKELAEKLVVAAKKEGLTSVAYLQCGERYRVYAHKYELKKEGEEALKGFRENFPGHKNAWLLSYRGR